MRFHSPEEMVISLKKLIKKIEQMESEFGNAEITRSQARILFPIIKDRKGYSIQELSNVLHVDKALVSRAITDLETKGIVEREKTADYVIKNHKIVLTPKGNVICESQKEKVREARDKWFNGITKNEIIQFLTVLKKLTEGNNA